MKYSITEKEKPQPKERVVAINNRVDLIGVVVNHPSQGTKTNTQGETVRATSIVLQIRNELPPIRTRVNVYIIDKPEDDSEESPSGFAAQEARYGTVIRVVGEIRPAYQPKNEERNHQMIGFNSWEKPDILAGPFNVTEESLWHV